MSLETEFILTQLWALGVSCGRPRGCWKSTHTFVDYNEADRRERNKGVGYSVEQDLVCRHNDADVEEDGVPHSRLG
jgi:hypothetical protein